MKRIFDFCVAAGLVVAVSGCSYLRSITLKSVDPKTGVITEKTTARAFTFFDANAQLSKFRNTTGQAGNGSNVWSYPSGTTATGVDVNSTSTNLASIFGAMAEGIVKGMK